MANTAWRNEKRRLREEEREAEELSAANERADRWNNLWNVPERARDAYIVHDGSDEVLAAFPDAPGQMAKAAEGDERRKDQNVYGAMTRGSNGAEPRIEIDKSAARFFYCAKASRADRDAGLAHMERVAPMHGKGNKEGGLSISNSKLPRANTHPTVKPTTLMQWLCRLITPPGGVILDPFMGSGSTGKAAVLEGFQFIGCEREDEYMPIATARIAWAIGASSTNTPDRDHVAAPAQPVAPANDNSPVGDLFAAPAQAGAA
jgi:site-specific DNA-methyltransferase (adenine-specific)